MKVRIGRFQLTIGKVKPFITLEQMEWLHEYHGKLNDIQKLGQILLFEDLDIRHWNKMNVEEKLRLVEHARYYPLNADSLFAVRKAVAEGLVKE